MCMITAEVFVILSNCYVNSDSVFPIMAQLQPLAAEGSHALDYLFVLF